MVEYTTPKGQFGWSDDPVEDARIERESQDNDAEQEEAFWGPLERATERKFAMWLAFPGDRP